MFRITCLLLGASLAMPSFAAERSASGAGAFNPKISLILNSQYAYYSVPDTVPAEVGGVLLGGDSGFLPPGFSLGETELAVESNVDDQFHGWAAISMAPEGTISVEEAFVNTLALPGGFALKLGRFKSDIGYQNHIHAHGWEFVDAPLVYRALLGTQYQDDGVQARWVAPADLLIELGGEALRGDAFPAGGDHRNGIGAWTGFLHVGGDAGAGGSWRLGLSHLHARAIGRGTGEEPDDTSFTGNSDVSGADLVLKWAPNGNPANTNFVFNAEYFFRKELGDLVNDAGGTGPTPGPTSSTYDGKQRGWYAQAIYQFMPRWRFGVRYDQLHADNLVPGAPGTGTALDLLADNSYDPRRASAMLDFSNSEFSRIRVQYNRDESRPGQVKDNQFFVQFIYSLGSHPAHTF